MLLYISFFPLPLSFHPSLHLFLPWPITEKPITQATSIKASGWQRAWTLHYRVSLNFITTIRLRCLVAGLKDDCSTHLLTFFCHWNIGNHKTLQASIRQSMLKCCLCCHISFCQKLAPKYDCSREHRSQMICRVLLPERRHKLKITISVFFLGQFELAKVEETIDLINK